MKRWYLALPLAGLTIAPSAPARAEGEQGSNILVRALKDEIKRGSDGLVAPSAKKPYFVAHRVERRKTARIAASFGAIENDDAWEANRLFTDVRIGSYASDSGNFTRDRWDSVRSVSLPSDDDYDVIRRTAWLAEDDAYKRAVDAFEKKQAARDARQSSPDKVDDFSHEAVTNVIDSGVVSGLDVARYRNLVKSLSAVGRSYPWMQASNAEVRLNAGRHSFVSSEGSVAVELRSGFTLNVAFRAQADDGMRLTHFVSYASCSMDAAPSPQEIENEAKRVATELDSIRRAPIVDDYTGPVLVEGRAAPQIIEQVLEEAFSGTPKSMSTLAYNRTTESELAGRVGERILPVGFQVEDDPRSDRIGSVPLGGCYKVDDEGVPAQKVTLVEDGIFKSFLMSRTPRKGTATSNGHARTDYRDGVRARVGSLVMSTKRGLASKDLRARLLAEVRATKRPYGIIVSLLDDGTVSRDLSFDERWADRDGGKSLLVVTKLKLDGTEERVRGGRLGPVTLATLKDILAAGNAPSVTTSGWDVQSSFVAPSLLFKEVVIKRTRDPGKKLPFMTRPEFTSASQAAPH